MAGSMQLQYLQPDDPGSAPGPPRSQRPACGLAPRPGWSSGWSRAWSPSPGWRWSRAWPSSWTPRCPAPGPGWPRCDWTSRAGGGCPGGSRRPPRRGTVPDRPGTWAVEEQEERTMSESMQIGLSTLPTHIHKHTHTHTHSLHNHDTVD